MPDPAAHDTLATATSARPCGTVVIPYRQRIRMAESVTVYNTRDGILVCPAGSHYGWLFPDFDTYSAFVRNLDSYDASGVDSVGNRLKERDLCRNRNWSVSMR